MQTTKKRRKGHTKSFKLFYFPYTTSIPLNPFVSVCANSTTQKKKPYLFREELRAVHHVFGVDYSPLPAQRLAVSAPVARRAPVIHVEDLGGGKRTERGTVPTGGRALKYD